MTQESSENVTYPGSPLGDNNILMNLANNVSNYKENLNLKIGEAPTFSYSSELINEVVENANKKIEDKKVNILEDYMAIFPLSVTILLLILILILIYVSFF